MEWWTVRLILLTLVVMVGCHEPTLSSFDNNRINALLSGVDENSEAFVQKGVQFDSIVTLAGQRTVHSFSDPIKMKLFYFDDMARGYFNLSDKDSKNLQIFGKNEEGYWVFKCVTKINMEEAGGYIILNRHNKGIWSNGHINFEKGTIVLEKQNVDYNSLTNW